MVEPRWAGLHCKAVPRLSKLCYLMTELIQTDKTTMAQHRRDTLHRPVMWKFSKFCFIMAELIENDKTSSVKSR
jgi:hypothetical protein